MKKNVLTPIFVLMLMALIIGCNNQPSSDSGDGDVDTTEEKAMKTNENEPKIKKGAKVTAVFGYVPIYKTPSTEKWLANVSIGATMEYLGESVVDSSENGVNTYLKVETSGEDEGWVNSYHAELETKPAVTNKDASIYKSPDLIEITDKKIDEMTIIAIKETKDEWAKVVYTNLSNWAKYTVWIQQSDISEDKHDIGVASVYHKMMNQNKEKSKAEKLEEILDMAKPFNSSAFYQNIQEELDDAILEAEEEEVEEEGGQ
jgi:hypothetical protein